MNLILAGIIAIPVTVFIKCGFDYLKSYSQLKTTDRIINKLLNDDSFRIELLNQVSKMVADKVEVLNGYKKQV